MFFFRVEVEGTRKNISLLMSSRKVIEMTSGRTKWTVEEVLFEEEEKLMKYHKLSS